MKKGSPVNTQLKRLIKELGDAINGSLAESEQIAQVIGRIKEEGYDIFLVLEATIGFNHHDEEGRSPSPELVSSRRKNSEPEFSITAHDVRFLKSLRISVDDAA
jgi:hypothetical protein